jgi:hypothetical protein
MSESMRMWFEITFNISYLIVVWGVVVSMYSKRENVRLSNRKVADLIRWAFALLAFGDTGHVGFRVLAYASGEINSTISIFGYEIGLVGLGALATAITVTLFYVLMLMVWHQRFEKPYGWFGSLLFVAALIRFIIMALPGNQWGNFVPPQTFGLIRNIPLMVQGLGLAYLVLRDANANNDKCFTWIGLSILVSYAMYIPVILFVQQVPIIGMLMIPKTMAYIAIAFIAYNELYREKDLVAIGVETGA